MAKKYIWEVCKELNKGDLPRPSQPKRRNKSDRFEMFSLRFFKELKMIDLGSQPSTIPLKERCS